MDVIRFEILILFFLFHFILFIFSQKKMYLIIDF